MITQLVAPGLRILIAAIFLYYGISKLRDTRRFAAVIHQHKLLPERFDRPVAWLLPLIEIATGLCFLFNIFPVQTGITICTLLIFFSLVLARSLLKPQLLINDCGCGAPLDGNRKPLIHTIQGALVRNSVLLVAVLAVIWTGPGNANTLQWPLFSLEVGALVIVLAPFVLARARHFSLERVHAVLQNRATGQVEPAKRRSFLKWGISAGLAVLTIILADTTVYAADVCNGNNCLCFVYCDYYQDCSDCPTQAPLYYVCWYFCCDATAAYCDATAENLGMLPC